MPDSSHVGEFSGESEWRKVRPSGISGWLKERYRRDICCWAEREEEGSVLMHIVHARIHGVYPARPKRRTWLELTRRAPNRLAATVGSCPVGRSGAMIHVVVGAAACWAEVFQDTDHQRRI